MLPDNADPDDFIRKHAVTEYQQRREATHSPIYNCDRSSEYGIVTFTPRGQGCGGGGDAPVCARCPRLDSTARYFDEGNGSAANPKRPAARAFAREYAAPQVVRANRPAGVVRQLKRRLRNKGSWSCCWQAKSCERLFCRGLSRRDYEELRRRQFFARW